MAESIIKYSVIIPHYNSLDVLPRAVDSVPDREDIEVLIVDNSTVPIDTHWFTDRRNVQILYSPSGKGAGAARNIGLENAKGKWLLFLDADDFFTPEAFEVFDTHVHSEGDIVFYKTCSSYSDTLKSSNRHIGFNQLIDNYLSTGEDEKLRYEWSSPWGKMIKRSLVETNHILFEETQAANDVMFSLYTSYNASKVSAFDDVVYCITTHEGSLTMTPSIENLTDRIDVFCRFNKTVHRHNHPDYQKSIMFYIYMAYKYHGFCTAFKLLCHSIRLGNNPFIGFRRWRKTANNLK